MILIEEEDWYLIKTAAKNQALSSKINNSRT